MKHFVFAITGASGAPYARRLGQLLSEADAHIHMVASAPAREVMADELGIRHFTVEALLDREAPNFTLYNPRDIGARIASGSFPTHGMVICPCSSHTLAAVACGLGDNLITRAAMVTLKEARRLILVPREMPISAVEIENMLRLSRSGAIICPACPGFYTRPTSVDDVVNFVVGRVLDLMGLVHDLNIRWNPDEHDRGRIAGPGAAQRE